VDLLAMAGQVRQTGRLIPVDRTKLELLSGDRPRFKRPVGRGPYGWFTGGMAILHETLKDGAAVLAEKKRWDKCPSVISVPDLGISYSQYCKALSILENQSFDGKSDDAKDIERSLSGSDPNPMSDQLGYLLAASRSLAVAGSDFEAVLGALPRSPWALNVPHSDRFQSLSAGLKRYQSEIKKLNAQAAAYSATDGLHADLIRVQLQKLSLLEAESLRISCPLAIATSLAAMKDIVAPQDPVMDFKIRILFNYLIELARTQTAQAGVNGINHQFVPATPGSPRGVALAASKNAKDEVLLQNDLEKWRSLSNPARGSAESSMITLMTNATTGYQCPVNDVQ